ARSARSGRSAARRRQAQPAPRRRRRRRRAQRAAGCLGGQPSSRCLIDLRAESLVPSSEWTSRAPAATLAAVADETAPELRVSDAEREHAATELREHLAEGRLTLDELAERLDGIYAARTRGELDAISADLPVQRRAAPPAKRPRRYLVAIMSGV